MESDRIYPGWDHIKDKESGRNFDVKYQNHKSGVEAYAWVDGIKVSKYGQDAQSVYWALTHAIYQQLNFRINPDDYRKV